MTVVALSRREQNKREKRSRVIAAARALFRHKGFSVTTTQEIADAAGVAAGTVFTYARTKDDLLILVFHDEILEVVERAYGLADGQGNLLEQAIVFFETLVAYHERDLPLSRLLMRHLGYVGNADQRALVRELMAQLLGRLVELIEAGKTRGELEAECPSPPLARSLFAIYHFHLGAMLSGYIERAQFDQNLREDLGLLLKGMGRTPSS